MNPPKSPDLLDIFTCVPIFALFIAAPKPYQYLAIIQPVIGLTWAIRSMIQFKMWQREIDNLIDNLPTTPEDPTPDPSNN